MKGVGSGLRVLMVATGPPWPPVGGGNLVLHHLASALVEAGARVRVLTLGGGPVDGAPYPLRTTGLRPRAGWKVAPHLLGGSPAALARWVVPAFAGELLGELEAWRPDVVHLEKLHLAWLLPLAAPRAAVVLREQNVESRLLERYAAVRRPPVGWLLAREARRVARAEAAACRAAHVVAAISEADARALAPWLPEDRLAVIPPAVETAGPAGEPAALEGDPALVCIGSFDWGPNRDGVIWFLREVWPVLRGPLPGAVLHLAGPGSAGLPEALEGVRRHGVVPSPRALYAPGRIAVVPVRAGSGVRLRILEAWAAGVPVASTTVGAEGLAAGPEDGVLIGDGPEELAGAVVRLAREAELARQLVARGRRLLRRFTPEAAAARALEAYGRALAVRRGT